MVSSPQLWLPYAEYPGHDIAQYVLGLEDLQQLSGFPPRLTAWETEAHGAQKNFERIRLCAAGRV